MGFAEPAIQQDLRKAAAGIAGQPGGHDAAHGHASQARTELYRAPGQAGFPGVSAPAEHGGVRLPELAIVCQPTSGQGCPLLPAVSSGVCAEILGTGLAPLMTRKAAWPHDQALEHIIRPPQAGVVTEIAVKPGPAVGTGARLARLAPPGGRGAGHDTDGPATAVPVLGREQA